MAAKLSDAQVKMLGFDAIEEASYRLENHPTSAYAKRANKLVEMGLLTAMDEKGAYGFDYKIYGITDLGRETLAALTPIEHEDAPDSETLADELPAYQECQCGQYLNDDETMCATCRTNGGKPREGRKLVMGRDGYPLGILDTAPVNIPEPTGPSLSSDQRAALDTHDATYCYLGMAPIAECTCKEHRFDTYKTSVDTFASVLSIYARKCHTLGEHKESILDASTEQSAVVQAAIGLVNLSKEREIASLKARVTALEEREARMEKQATKHREFVRDMCGYSFNDKDDARFVSDCVDELESDS